VRKNQRKLDDDLDWEFILGFQKKSWLLREKQSFYFLSPLALKSLTKVETKKRQCWLLFLLVKTKLVLERKNCLLAIVNDGNSYNNDNKKAIMTTTKQKKQQQQKQQQ